MSFTRVVSTSTVKSAGDRRLPPPGSKRTGSSVTGVFARWCDLTWRPYGHTTCTDEIMRQLSPVTEMNKEQVDECLSVAATMEPQGDKNDITRLCDALEGEGTKGDSTVYSPWTQDAINSVLGVLGLTVHQVTGDQTGAIKEFIQMKPEVFTRRANRTMDYLGVTSLQPKDVLAQQVPAWVSDRKPSQTNVPRKAQRNSLETAIRDTADFTVSISYDERGEACLVRGMDEKDIRHYHNMAPKGYWDSVKKWCEDNSSLDLQRAYTALRPLYAWHPDDRGLPTTGAK